MRIPVAFEVAWVLASLSQPNHIVFLCSGVSLAWRWRASSSVFIAWERKKPQRAAFFMKLTKLLILVW